MKKTSFLFLIGLIIVVIALLFMEDAKASTININIKGVMGESNDHYTSNIKTLQKANSGDIIIIHIDSSGGLVSEAQGYVYAIGNSQAHVVLRNEGMAYSSAGAVYCISGAFDNVTREHVSGAIIGIHSITYGGQIFGIPFSFQPPDIKRDTGNMWIFNGIQVGCKGLMTYSDWKEVYKGNDVVKVLP